MPVLKHRLVRESFGEPGVCCRFFIMKKESCPKELPVTGRNIPVVASCWMWAIHLNDNGFVQFFDNDWNKTYAAFRLE
eukprot:3038926-Prorocentrum_lima.AAC.1